MQDPVDVDMKKWMEGVAGEPHPPLSVAHPPYIGVFFSLPPSFPFPFPSYSFGSFLFWAIGVLVCRGRGDWD